MAVQKERPIMARRNYTREFKLSAVQLVKEQGYSIAQAAKSLGVDDASVRYWTQKLGKEVGGPASGEAALRTEVQRLRKENARLLMEREILKKAAAFFAKEPM
jgi:transposase